MREFDDILRPDGGAGHVGDRVGRLQDLCLRASDLIDRFFGVALDGFGQVLRI